MESHPPLVVYKNLNTLLNYRKLKLINGSLLQKDNKNLLSDKDFIYSIKTNNFVIVEAHPENPASVLEKTFIIISEELEAIKAGDIEKMMNKIPKIKSLERDFDMNILIVTRDPLNTHAEKKILQYTNSNSPGKIRIKSCVYTILMYDLFKYNLVNPHRILSESEEIQVLDDLKTTKNLLPKISSSDPPVLILDGRIGQIVEIECINFNSGLDIKYRHINK